MSLTCAVLFLLTAGQPVQAEKAPVPVMAVWAVQATGTGEGQKHFDPELEGARKALEHLPFNKFKALSEIHGEAPYNHEIMLPVAGRYTVYVKPVERRADGRVKLVVRVEMPARELRGKPVQALKAELLLVPGELIKVQGFFLDEGELILVMRVDFPKASGGG